MSLTGMPLIVELESTDPVGEVGLGSLRREVGEGGVIVIKEAQT